MTVAAGAYTLGKYRGTQVENAKFRYSFAADTGAQATYVLGTFSHAAIIIGAQVHVATACTSSGSATVAIGMSSADADGFLTAAHGAVANLTLDAMFHETTSEGLKIAAGETVNLVIGAADLTAGIVDVYVQYIAV